MPDYPLRAVVVKTTVIHTVTYFVIGALAFALLGYATTYSDPAVARALRPTSDPWVAAGPLFQVLRGALFGVAFYPLREVVFARRNGWLTLWLVLVVVGILSPFGSAPGSIEGAVYTVLPLWFHLSSLPEILIQSGLLAFLTAYWLDHPEKKWLGWVLGIAFALVLLFGTLGALAALGVLPAPAR
jgi:hypothetical protein